MTWRDRGGFAGLWLRFRVCLRGSEGERNVGWSHAGGNPGSEGNRVGVGSHIPGYSQPPEVEEKTRYNDRCDTDMEKREAFAARNEHRTYGSLVYAK